MSGQAHVSVKLIVVLTEKDKERSTLSTHASSAAPELNACEACLSCVVEGIEKDQLLIRFSNVDKSDPDREFSFVLDFSRSIYKGATHLTKS